MDRRSPGQGAKTWRRETNEKQGWKKLCLVVGFGEVRNKRGTQICYSCRNPNPNGVCPLCMQPVHTGGRCLVRCEDCERLMCWNCEVEHDHEGCGTIGWPPPTGVKSSGGHCELSRQEALQSGPRSATGTCVSILCLTHRLCRYDVSSERHAYAEGRTVELPENEETHPPVACGCVDKACRNMCAVEHQVGHYDAISSQTLFQDAQADSEEERGGKRRSEEERGGKRRSEKERGGAKRSEEVRGGARR